jgi:steroid delta-isomerase-like uncharacterized protein
MSATSPVERAYDAVWDDGNLAAVSEVYAGDCVVRVGSGRRVDGAERLADYVADLHGAFPDLTLAVDERVVGDDAVVTEWTTQGTHEGAHMGLPPTGREVAVSGVCVDRVANGDIRETTTYLDALGLFRQLGLAPDGN